MAKKIGKAIDHYDLDNYNNQGLGKFIKVFLRIMMK